MYMWRGFKGLCPKLRALWVVTRVLCHSMGTAAVSVQNEIVSSCRVVFWWLLSADKKVFDPSHRSQYYIKYGNPNFGGMKGLISGSLWVSWFFFFVLKGRLFVLKCNETPMLKEYLSDSYMLKYNCHKDLCAKFWAQRLLWFLRYQQVYFVFIASLSEIMVPIWIV